MNKKLMLSVLLTATYALSAQTAGTADAELMVGIAQGNFFRASDALEVGANKDIQFGSDRNSAITQALIQFINARLWFIKKFRIELALTAAGASATAYYSWKILPKLFPNEYEDVQKIGKKLWCQTGASALAFLGLGGKTLYDGVRGNKKKLNDRFKIIELLIAHKANLSATNAKGQTAFHIIENCLLEHADDKYLVNSMKAILELLQPK